MLDEVHYQNHEVVVVGWDDEYPRENFRYRIDRDTEGGVMDGPGQEATPSDMEKGASFEPFSGGRRRSSGRAAMPSDLELSESEIATGSDMKAERDDEEGVLTPVKDQASTNTCWPFGSTAAVESSYLLNGSNLYDFNYSSGISLETELPLTEEGRLRWELSGDLSAVDTSDFEAETGGTGLTENGEAVCLFTPEESGILTVKVSSAGDPTKTASCQVVLLEDNAVDRISLSPETLRLRGGQTHQLEVSIEAPEGSQVRAGGEEAVCTVTVWKPGRSEGEIPAAESEIPGRTAPSMAAGFRLQVAAGTISTRFRMEVWERWRRAGDGSRTLPGGNTAIISIQMPEAPWAPWRRPAKPRTDTRWTPRGAGVQMGRPRRGKEIEL